MENQNEIPEKILRQIKHLLDFANDGRGAKEEMEAAAAKASALMLKYNLEMHQIKKENPDGMDGVQIRINDRQSKNDGNFVLGMYNIIAKNNFCKVIHLTSNHNLGNIAILGTKVNIHAVGYIADQLIERIKNLEIRVWKDMQDRTQQKRNAFRRGYYAGAVAGIGVKLAMQREHQRKQAEEEEQQKAKLAGYIGDVQMTTALVRMEQDNSAALTAYMEQQFPNSYTDTRKKKTLKAADAKALGYAHGKAMNIHKGLENTTAGMIDLNQEPEVFVGDMITYYEWRAKQHITTEIMDIVWDEDNECNNIIISHEDVEHYVYWSNEFENKYQWVSGEI